MAVIAPQTEQSQTEPQGLFAFLDAAEHALDDTDPAC